MQNQSETSRAIEHKIIALHVHHSFALRYLYNTLIFVLQFSIISLSTCCIIQVFLDSYLALYILLLYLRLRELYIFFLQIFKKGLLPINLCFANFDNFANLLTMEMVRNFKRIPKEKGTF